jgi:S-adenosylmethionine hydrolase
MKRISVRSLIAFVLCFIIVCASAQNKLVVLQTDFGLKDGAVSEMKGVIMQVDPSLRVFDITHEIPAYNIWDAAYRLDQTIVYWPKGTVFISVVDPGVGSERKAVVAETMNGYFIVTPDNGTLTLIAEHYGMKSVRQIDEAVNRLPGSNASNTFHGRDIFAYTAARLASKKISFLQVGPSVGPSVVRLKYQPAVVSGDSISGTIPALDVQYGNVWTNIPNTMLEKAGFKNRDLVAFTIYHGDTIIYNGKAPITRTFSDVPAGEPLAYINSLLNFSVALNMDSFASKYKVSSGPDWHITIRKTTL